MIWPDLSVPAIFTEKPTHEIGERQICEGCGSCLNEGTLAALRLRNPNFLSCCPERKPVAFFDLVRERDELLRLNQAMRQERSELRRLLRKTIPDSHRTLDIEFLDLPV